jgi:hypothetical protein
MRKRSSRSIFLNAAMAVLVMCAAGGCDDDSSTPTRCDPPPLSVLSVDVTEFRIHVLPMMPGPDYLYSDVTLRIENTSSKHSYSGVSLASAGVYRASDNQLLGEIMFETDWDGTIDAGEIVTVEFDKIIEAAQIFPDPCDELLYLEITITSPEYGEMKVGTPTYLCSCLI